MADEATDSIGTDAAMPPKRPLGNLDIGVDLSLEALQELGSLTPEIAERILLLVEREQEYRHQQMLQIERRDREVNLLRFVGVTTAALLSLAIIVFSTSFLRSGFDAASVIIAAVGTIAVATTTALQVSGRRETGSRSRPRRRVDR